MKNIFNAIVLGLIIWGCTNAPKSKIDINDVSSKINDLVRSKKDISDLNCEETNFNPNFKEGENSILNYAVMNENITNVKKLIECGANVNLLQEKGMSIIMTSAYLNSRFEIFDYLINKGADLNIVDEFGNSVLHYFGSNFDPDLKIGETLLNKNFNVNITNYNHATPLFKASEDNNVKVMNFLINNGAKINIQDKNGLTPIYHSISFCRPNIFKEGFNMKLFEDESFLSELEKDPFNKCLLGNKLLLDKGADLSLNPYKTMVIDPITIAKKMNNLLVLSYIKE